MNQLNKEEYSTRATTTGGNSLDCGNRRISTASNQGKSLYAKWFSCVLALALGLSASTTPASPSHGDQYRYKYISLTEVPVPSGFGQFIPTVIDDSGRVYGDVYDDSGIAHVAVYAHGALTVYQPGNATAVNARGTIGGAVSGYPQTNDFQAALFRGDRVELIPYRPGETRTFVVSLNDSGTALVRSEDPFVLNTYRLYNKGKDLFSYQLPTGSDVRSWGVNNGGIVSGNIYDPNLNAFRAIRFRRPYGEPLLLDPIPTDSDSISFGINSSGNILGDSQSADPTKHHYGIWDWKGNFKTYYEGINYFALFNDNNLMVLTGNYDTDLNSYLVPSPGVRLNVEDLLVNAIDIEATLAQVVDINNHGDMIGYGLFNGLKISTFLLRRVPPKEH